MPRFDDRTLGWAETARRNSLGSEPAGHPLELPAGFNRQLKPGELGDLIDLRIHVKLEGLPLIDLFVLGIRVRIVQIVAGIWIVVDIIGRLLDQFIWQFI